MLQPQPKPSLLFRLTSSCARLTNPRFRFRSQFSFLIPSHYTGSPLQFMFTLHQTRFRAAKFITTSRGEPRGRLPTSTSSSASSSPQSRALICQNRFEGFDTQTLCNERLCGLRNKRRGPGCVTKIDEVAAVFDFGEGFGFGSVGIGQLSGAYA
ncbi:hypothetical protein K402DRAFT_397687 [Aulographum hederae CBS 113979]|uniref:Uncharacterized protein n=1 Tax=Aulographum hederae CBS 113979 TaxID=1176131 RepID=A0A6G1GMR1_9PEZI|nr:hypothetical protein K402DRAFT_397687 [Aulographum hederae CBS 113979]